MDRPLSRRRAADARVAAALHAWFSRHGRDLPWRRVRDPWAVWVSEVMLQQTRVDTVTRRWPAFMARYPTPRALAEAPLDEVQGAWAGLGYYRRCRLLREGARALLAEHGGVFPRTVSGLRALPSIGAYTASAIAAIAFDEPTAAIDGNVLRVGGRVLGLREPVHGSKLRGAVRAWANALVAKGEPRVLVQALMEVGALLCKPTTAGCTACPLEPGCAAARLEDPTSVPLPGRRPKVHAWRGVLWLPRLPGDRVGLRRRPEEGVLRGLWFPPGTVGPAEDPAIQRAWNDPQAFVRGAAGGGHPEAPTARAWRFTHIDLCVQVLELPLATPLRMPGLRYETRTTWEELGIPSATRHFLGTPR